MLDRDRLVEVLSADYSYYGGPQPTVRMDDRLHPGTAELIGAQLRPDMRVLDAGCGDGATLLRFAEQMAYGVGIENDPEHLALAERARAKAGVEHIRFEPGDLLEAPIDRPEWRAGFDFVFSERGPVSYDVRGVQAALWALRTDGLVFAEVIGDLHMQEVREVFAVGARFNQSIRALDQVKVAMERSGVGIRVASDVMSKAYYPDIYEWLTFQCGIWVWAGGQVPAPDDPRLELFARKFGTGEIEVTHHVCWVGGVKLADPAGYREYSHFD